MTEDNLNHRDIIHSMSSIMKIIETEQVSGFFYLLKLCFMTTKGSVLLLLGMFALDVMHLLWLFQLQ